ncbi:MAG TPA: AsnC family transcriptional regulator, partial [Candidatus Methanomethylia archaeon]|nr:AsnC family transcriptional regulator [Candidatus Methanomethylicia archaeon]
MSRRKRTSLDAIDHKLIEILKTNSRTSFKQIAKEVGLSSVAVRNRVNKLVKLGVIKGFFALVDPKELGRELSVIMDVTVNP